AEGAVDALLDVRHRFSFHLGDLADEEELGTVEHPLLAEGEGLLARKVGEALQHHGNLVEAARAHLVGVLLETALPVGVLVDPPVRQEVEDLPYVRVRDHMPESDAVGVLLRHPDPRVVREDPELIQADLAAGHGAGLNALYHPDAVVRVDDLLTDLEIHTNLAFHTRQLVGCLRAFFGRGTDLSKSHIGRANLEPSVSFAERSYADEGARGRG